MNWWFLGRCAWHGFSAAAIAFGTSVAVLDAWPTKLQWLVLAGGCLVALAKGVEGFLQEANVA